MESAAWVRNCNYGDRITRTSVCIDPTSHIPCANYICQQLKLHDKAAFKIQCSMQFYQYLNKCSLIFRVSWLEISIMYTSLVDS